MRFPAYCAALLRMLHLPASRAGEWVARVIDQTVAESHKRRPGGDAVLERRSEVMFVDAAGPMAESIVQSVSGGFPVDWIRQLPHSGGV